MNPTKNVVDLSLVESLQEIRDNLIKFNQDALSYDNRARNLLKHTSYWVTDASEGLFGPSKFLGFQSMNFVDYEAATKGHESKKIFNGTITRSRIEKTLDELPEAYTIDLFNQKCDLVYKYVYDL